MLSVVIPHWPLRPEHDTLLDRCVKSLSADEIIVVVNDGIGMGKAINIGLRLSHGDYIIVSNNDLEVIGNLDELCLPDAIGVPLVNGLSAVQACGSFYCMPRGIYEQVGGYDEQFGVGYYEDEDLFRRWQEDGVRIIEVPSVNIVHAGGATLNTLPNRAELLADNKAKFEKKWHD